jgi:methylated-DNA-protein-cysteine methyltransferase-like protein
MAVLEPDFNQRIWQVVAAVPAGKVTTYGTVAARAGLPHAARRVGAALHVLPQDTQIPWHRIVNAQGRLSLPKDSPSYQAQRSRLENEGIAFRLNGSIDLRQYGW